MLESSNHAKYDAFCSYLSLLHYGWGLFFLADPRFSRTNSDLDNSLFNRKLSKNKIRNRNFGIEAIGESGV